MEKKDPLTRKTSHPKRRRFHSTPGAAGKTHPAGAVLPGMIENSEAGYFYIDREGIIRRVNRAWLRMHGYETPEEVIGKHFSLTQTDLDIDSAVHNVAELLAGRPIPSGEFTRRRKDGAIGYHTFSASPVVSNGETVGLEGFLIDTTGQHNLAEQLRSEHERLQGYMDTVETVIVALDARGNIAAVNKKGCQLFGYPEEELIGQSWFATCLPQTYGMDVVYPVFLKLMAGEIEATEYFENRVMTRSGEQRYIAWHNTLLKNGRGKITGTLSSGNDITDRKRMEEELRRTRVLLEQSIEQSPIPMVMVTMPGAMISIVNSAYRTMLGIEDEPVQTGQSLFEVQLPYQYYRADGTPVGLAELPIARALSGRRTDGEELRLVRRDTKELWLLVSAAPILDSRGEIIAACLTLADISEQKKTKLALQENLNLLSQAERIGQTGSWQWNLATNAFHCSQGMMNIMALPNNKPVSIETFLSCLQIDDLEGMRQKSRTAFKQKMPFVQEFRIALPDGTVRHILGRAEADLDAQGEAALIRGYAQDITDRRMAEEKYERLFKEILDAFALHEIICDDQGRPVNYRFLAVNPAFERMTGLKSEDVVGRTVLTVLPGTEPYWIDTYGKVALTGEPAFFENYTATLKKHFEVSAFRTAPGQFACIFADITERKQAQDNLTKERDLLYSIAETSPVGITFVDRWGQIVYANQRAEKILGLGRDEITGQFYNSPLWRITNESGEPLPETDLPFTRVMATGKPVYDVRHTIVRSDGMRIYLSINAAPLHEPDGNIGGMVAALEDITERTRAEAAIRESEEKFSRAFQKAPLLMIISSVDDGRVIDINEAVTNLSGYTREEAIGKTTLELGWITTEERNLMIPELREKGISEARETEAVDRQGKKISCLVYRDIITFGGQKRLLTLAQNVTEQKRAEEERLKLEGQLRQAQKMESIGRLAGGVAHDFNNILGVILGNTEMAMEQVSRQSELYEQLKEIRKAANRSADLTRQLLAFARKQTVTPRVLNLNQAVENSIKMLKRLIGENIELVWRPGPEIWQVLVDPTQIDQILANLCVNARDAISETGSITITTANTPVEQDFCALHIGLVPGDFVRLSVSDTGCGMDRDTLSNIFEPFFTTKELGKGTGLGLATVYGIVEQNNGCIDVVSESGKGSTFNLYLPRHKGKADQTPTKDKPEQATAGRETILLVEDEPAMLKMTHMILERQGYRVLTAASPGEAVQKARKYPDPIHLLITDVVMPEMNGRDLAKKILSLDPNVKRLFISGYTADVIAHHGMLEEGTNFIQKPYSKNDLTAKVREILDRD